MNKYPVILTMIVKNEAHIISRSLDSTLPHVDGVVIVDTGSTDNTLEVIFNILKNYNLPSIVSEKEWVNFSVNRNQSLVLAEEMLNDKFPDKGGYIYILDADDKFINYTDEPFRDLDGVHGYSLRYYHAGSIYRRTQLFPAFRNITHRWRVHEDYDYRYTKGFNKSDFINIDTCAVDFVHGGSRSKDPNTYLKDIGLLLLDLEESPNSEHPMYFLATAYKDTNQIEKSVEMWKRLLYKSDAWDSQKWYACIQIALMSNNCQDYLYYMSKAYEYNKERYEPYYYLSKRLREEGLYRAAYMYGKMAKGLGKHSQEFFLDNSIYDWKIDDETSISAYYIGEYKESLELCDKVLEYPNLSSGDKDRVNNNKSFARRALGLI